jgi:DNA polymerase-1
MKTLVLLDSNAIVHRAYHALPKSLSNSKGELTNVTYGFALALIKVLEELHPTHIAAAFDLGAPTFRHLEYVEYKAKRVKADQELYDQIPRVKEMLEALGIPVYAKEGYEADDVIGTITDQIQKSNLKSQRDNSKVNIFIASGDKDVYQLLNGHVKVLMLKRGFSEAEIFDHKHLKEVYNLDPGDFIDLKALAGDPSDNIPGIPGVGPKTATDLIQRFDTLEKLYKQIAQLLNCSIADLTIEQSNNETIELTAKKLEIKPRILKLLAENKNQAFQSQRLATIRRDVPIKFSLEDCRWGQYDRERLRKLFEELQFKSLLARFGKTEEVESEKLKGERGWGLSPEGTVPSGAPSLEQKKKDAQLKLEL